MKDVNICTGLVPNCSSIVYSTSSLPNVTHGVKYSTLPTYRTHQGVGKITYSLSGDWWLLLAGGTEGILPMVGKARQNQGQKCAFTGRLHFLHPQRQAFTQTLPHRPLRELYSPAEEKKNTPCCIFEMLLLPSFLSLWGEDSMFPS